MKLESWASKGVFFILFCKVLTTNTEDDNLFGDKENLLENVDAIENQSQSPISNNLLDNSLDEHISTSNTRGKKIVEFKKVSQQNEYNSSQTIG